MASFDPRTVRHLTDARTSRRRLLQGGAALGLGAALPIVSHSRGAGAQDVTKLKFSHDKSPWQQFFKDMGDLAQKEININWDVTPYSDTTSYQTALKGALPTSDTPDLFTWWSGYRLEELYTAGVLEDLTDIWTKAVSDGNAPESLGAAFTFDGKVYSFPLHVSYWVVFYNKKVFADNGITAAPATWADFTAACDKLKTAGVTPMASTVVGSWPSFILFEEMVLRTDPQFYLDLTAGKAKYTDPTAVKAMDTWKGLIDNGYFTSFDAAMDTDWPGMFAQGQVAMIPVGTWYQSNFTAQNMKPGEDYDLFIMPNVDPAVTQKVAIVETGALAVAAKSSQIDAAKQFVSWWVSTDAQTAWSNKLGDTPANTKAVSDNPILKTLLDTLANDHYTLYQRYWEASPVPIVEGAVTILQEFMLDTSKEQDVLQKIQDLADTEWAKRGGPAGTPTSS
ncbi:MAG TPA: extracellular solute-binding protein [Thermomicrobiales bacterium]|jgi:multiple sugar transport system substrate-binding protein